MCTVDKVEYLSEAVANNAVQLHLFCAPDCTTFAAYPCDDQGHDLPHWHTGHDGLTAEARAKAAACKAAHPFAFRRRQRHRRHHHRRHAA